MLDLLVVIIIIIASLFALVKGADYLVDGSADLARYLKVSPILIGLTIVAFGTSLPEFAVSLFSAIAGKSDLSVGNIIGSNIFNIAGIIGISAIIANLKVKSKTLIYEFPFLIISGFLLLILADDIFIFGKNNFLLGRIDGLIFIAFFSLFLYYIFYSMNADRHAATKQFKEAFQHKNSIQKNTLMIVGGLVAVLIGGRLFVIAASSLGELINLSEAFIGLVIAAIGTSLPELATSAVAAWKRQNDIAIGTIVGSNIFNILFILGTVSLIRPLDINPELLKFDAVVMMVVSILFLIFAAYKKKIGKTEGVVLLVIYGLYLSFLLFRHIISI